MPIVRTRDHIEEFRYRAKFAGSVAALAARDAERNLAIANAILPLLDLGPEDVVLDVGCGDGSLLRLAEAHGAKVIGVLPTHDEVARLKNEYPDLEVRRGVAQHLPLPDKSVSKLACNSVLLYLVTEPEVRRALREFARVASKLVFIGEVPAQPVESNYDHGSVPAWLWSLLRKSGPRHFLAGIRDVLQATVTEKALLFYPEQWFNSPPESFVAIAAGCGLSLVAQRRTPHAPERCDYVFSV